MTEYWFGRRGGLGLVGCLLVGHGGGRARRLRLSLRGILSRCLLRRAARVGLSVGRESLAMLLGGGLFLLGRCIALFCLLAAPERDAGCARFCWLVA